jgi:restriction system protein
VTVLFADVKGFSDADREELLPSGRQSKFTHRVAWAKVYLAQAGLLLSTGALSNLRPRSRRAEGSSSPYRHQIFRAVPGVPRVQDYKDQYRERPHRQEQPEQPELVTAEETLETAHLNMRASLATEILARIKSGTPESSRGSWSSCGSRWATAAPGVTPVRLSQAGEEGIDGIISEDRLGLDVVYLQAKKWEGPSVVQKSRFVDALHGKRAEKGVFITTGMFSSEASGYVEHIEPKVVLIDGRRLAELIIDFELGVTTARTYHVKRIDSDYFDEERTRRHQRVRPVE